MKQMLINDKPQGSVATLKRCDGLFNNYFTTSLPQAKKIKSVNIWQHPRSRVDCVALCAPRHHPGILLKDEEFTINLKQYFHTTL